MCAEAVVFSKSQLENFRKEYYENYQDNADYKLPGNLIISNSPIQLFTWRMPNDQEICGWNVWKNSPFNQDLEVMKQRKDKKNQVNTANSAASKSTALATKKQLPTIAIDPNVAVQNYFAEYHLEFFRQRRFKEFPSRLQSKLLFISRVDALAFYRKNVQFLSYKVLGCVQTTSEYTLSYHDAAWLEVLRRANNLSLPELDNIAENYWSGKTVQSVGGIETESGFWNESQIIEVLLQGGSPKNILSPLMFMG